VELLAAISGNIRRVSAIGPKTPDASFASLQVQMTADAVPALRWSVGATSAAAPGMQLSMIGERGAVTLRQFAAAEYHEVKWRLTDSTNDTSEVISEEVVDAALLTIDRFAAATNDALNRRETSTWETATRDMEVVDAVELSLQKGRTIEVFQQHLTERLAFRGTMAALGCGLLLLAFFSVIGIAALGGAEGLLGQRIAPGWPLVLLAVLALFLLLQSLPMLVGSTRKKE
jgi:hypothetical protein